MDDLHQHAGSADAIALHGCIAQDRWLDMPQSCCSQDALEDGHSPRCPVCGNLRRPAVVWFGEHLPQTALDAAEAAVQRCA